MSERPGKLYATLRFWANPDDYYRRRAEAENTLLRCRDCGRAWDLGPPPKVEDYWLCGDCMNREASGGE
jgi:hypothetical protein